MHIKKLNSLFITIILLLLTANIFELLYAEHANNLINKTKDNSGFSLVEIYKDNKNKTSNEQLFNELLEDIFTSDNNDQNPWLLNEYKNLIKVLNEKEEETFYSNLNDDEKEKIIFVNENTNEEKLIKDYCFVEKNKLAEKIKSAENALFNLELEKKQFSKELERIEDQTKKNEEDYKTKNEEIKTKNGELKQLNNSIINPNFGNDNNYTESILLIDSLISLVKQYFYNLQKNKDDEKNKRKYSETFEANFLEKIKKAEKINDYSLTIFLSEIANKHINGITNELSFNDLTNLSEFKSETQTKIMQLLENMKKKYEEKQKDNIIKIKSIILLKEKELENEQKYVELLVDELNKNKNDFKFLKEKLKIINQSITDFNINNKRLNDLNENINKICY